MNETQLLKELAQNLTNEVAYWKGLLAIALKSQGGTMKIKKAASDIEPPFEVAMRRVDPERLPDTTEIELKLLEGQDEIEAVLGKPSPIIVPK